MSSTVVASPNPGSWEATYREHAPELLAFLVRRLPRQEDAEDLLHEVFVRAIRAGSMRQESRARAYLFATAHNVLISHLRRRKVAEVSERSGLTAEAAPVSRSRTADEVAERMEIEARLKGAIARMTPTERAAFERAVLQKRPYHEVARELGWSRSQVKVYVHRARQRALRDLVGVLTPSESEGTM